MSSRLNRLYWLLGVVGVVLLHAAPIHATAVPVVPEISPSSVTAGLAVLTGAVLMLRSLRR